MRAITTSNSGPGAELNDGDAEYQRGLRFVRRVYLPRLFVCLALLLSVTAMLVDSGASSGFYFVALSSALIWPNLAYLVGVRSSNPGLTGRRQLLADAFLTTFWLPVFSFNAMAFVVLTVPTAMNSMVIGGFRTSAKTFLAQFAGVLAGVALVGVNFRALPGELGILGSLPLLFLYPLIMGIMVWRIERKLEVRNRELRLISCTDPLSGLYNRRHWSNVLHHAFERGARLQAPYSLILFDIDHFKLFNDDYGHALGDAAILAVSKALKVSLRSYDTAARFGGDEFGVLVSEASAETARLIAERLAAHLSQPEKTGLPRTCTLSIGIAERHSGLADIEQWQNEADRALYAAKAGGRNQIKTASE